MSIVQVDPHHPGTVLAATGNALLFRSVNDGESWAPLPFPAELRATLHAFAIHPATPDVYLAGLASESAEYSGMFRTSDAGATWQRVAGLGGRDIWSLAFWPRDPRVIAAGTRDGVFLTRDDGLNWNRVSPAENRELQPVVSIAFDPQDSGIIYAGTPHLPWKTVDGGRTWRSIHAGMLDDSDVFSIQVDRSRRDRVFASACSGIYRSLDGGVGWVKLTGARGASYRSYFISQVPNRPDTVFAGTTYGLIQSLDGGTTWRRLTSQATRSIAFDPNRPGRFFIATDETGILRSDDSGSSLKAVNEGLCNRYLTSLVEEDATLFTSTMNEPGTGGVFRLAANGNRWERISSRSQLLGEVVRALAPVPCAPGSIYATAGNAVLLSTDGGKAWTRTAGPPGSTVITAVAAPACDPKRVLVATDSGIFRSEDAGRTWHRADVAAGSIPVNSLVRLTPLWMAAFAGSRAFLSEDGIAWKPTAAISGNTSIYSLVATAEHTLLAATSAGLMRSDDFGASWAPMPGSLQGSSISAMCKHPTRADALFAARYGVIYASDDGGRSWTQISPKGSSMGVIKQLVAVDGAPDRLFALTQRKGVFRLDLPTSTASLKAEPK